MRFVVGQDYGEDSYHSHTQDVQEELFDNDSVHCTTGALSAPVRKGNASNNPKATYGSFSVSTKFPQEIMKVREVIPHTGPIPIVIPVKLFLDLLQEIRYSHEG